MTHESAILPWIVVLPAIGAFINGLFGHSMPKRLVTTIAVGAPVLAFLLALLVLAELLGIPTEVGALAGDHEAYRAVTAHVWSWIQSDTLHVSVDFMVDPLSAIMLLVVSGVGSLIHIFSIGYMWDDKAYWRYFAFLNLFMFSMFLLILGQNLLILFVGWEGVGLCSYLLIGFWFTDAQKAAAGQKAFVVNRIGDFGFLLGIFILLFYSQGDLDFLRLPAVFGAGGVLNPHEPGLTAAVAHNRELTVTLIGLLFFVGATGKSAQIPLYVWLPDAMAGPTPVSALIHAATMVTAGVYMMARLNFLYVLSPTAMTVIATVGGATALFAATMALVQYDIKKVLAYSTVSQLGYMVLAIGVGSFVGAIFHLMTHAFFKACLFLDSGSVIHGLHHEQDIRKMGGLKKKFPITARTFYISTLAISGIPLFSGFFSKDEILFTAATSSQNGAPPHTIPYILGALAALLTAFYMFRLYYLTFEGEYRGDAHTWEHAHEERVMTTPLIVLGFLAAFGGLLGLPIAVGHALGFEHWNILEGFLAPVFSAAEHVFHYNHELGTEILYMGISVAIALLGWGVARSMYKRPNEKLPVAPVDAVWFKVLYNKWYVDEIYDALVVRPFAKLSDLAYRGIDRAIIDKGLVHGVAKLADVAGAGLRQLQTGDVQAYVTAVVVGLAVLLAYAVA